MHCAIANFEFRIFVHDSMLKVDNAVAEIHDWLSPFEVAMSLKCVPFFPSRNQNGLKLCLKDAH